MTTYYLLAFFYLSIGHLYYHKLSTLANQLALVSLFNSDFRVVAHRILEAMHTITSSHSDPFQLKFVEEGAVTVLISLLSNEAGVVCHYSCSILANLLVWEARRNLRIRRHHQQQDHYEESDDEESNFTSNIPSQSLHTKVGSGIDATTTTFKPLRDQLEACGGKNMLVSLLTSPSASINLAGNVARVTGGFREKRMQASVEGTGNWMSLSPISPLFISITFTLPTVFSSFVSPSPIAFFPFTGVSSREAARALITLFNPKKPVPSSTSLSLEDQETDEDAFGGMNNGSFSSSTTSHNYASSPKSSPSSSSPIKRSSFNRRSQSFVAGSSSSSSGGGGSPSKLPPLLHSHSLTLSPAVSPAVSPITPLLESQSHKGVLGTHRADAVVSPTTGANAGVKSANDAKTVADVLTASTSSTITNTTVTTNPNTNTTTSSSVMGNNGKDMMSSLFLSENYARPWRFSYYHKRYVLLLFFLQPSVTLILA